MTAPLHPPATVPEFPPRNHDAQAMPLRPLESEVTHARVTVTRMLAGLVPHQHLDDVELVTSELVTNAVNALLRRADMLLFEYAYTEAPILLSVWSTERWTRIDVQDPLPCMHTPYEPPAPSGLAESGRGLAIIEALGHWTCTICLRCKVMHAVLPIGQEPLTSAEIAEALPHLQATS